VLRRWGVVGLVCALSLWLPNAAQARPLDTLRRLPFAATHVAVYWHGHPDAVVRVAFSRDGRTFARSVDAGRDDIGAQRHNGITYGAVLAAPRARVVRILSNQPIAQMSVVALPGRPVKRLLARVTNPEPASPHTPRPPILSRADWGANESLRFSNGSETWPPAFAPTTKLIVHHTDTSNDYADQAGAEAQIRSIYYYHSVTQGWGDIGYNFLIDKFGNIWVGRAGGPRKPVIGAQVYGFNHLSTGVSVIGNFEEAKPGRRVLRSVGRLLGWKLGLHGVRVPSRVAMNGEWYGAINGHRDAGQTLCPGTYLYRRLPAIRRYAAAWQQR